MAGKRADDEQAIARLAFAELLVFIEEAHMDDETFPVFKLADLAQLYTSRMEQLGVKHEGRAGCTQPVLSRLLAHFPNMCAQHQGRDVLLAFNEDIGDALAKACELDSGLDAIHLARAAQIVRRHIIGDAKVFNGFPAGCQQDSVSPMLLALVIKRGEETGGGWCNDPQELGQLPQSRREQDRAVHLLSGVLHNSFQLADKELVITEGDDVLSKPPLLDTAALAPCNHEEADSRMMLHAAHAAHNGHKKILIRTVDTDFVVLAVALARTLEEGAEVLVFFGTGKAYRFLVAHEMARALKLRKHRHYRCFMP